MCQLFVIRQEYDDVGVVRSARIRPLVAQRCRILVRPFVARVVVIARASCFMLSHARSSRITIAQLLSSHLRRAFIIGQEITLHQHHCFVWLPKILDNVSSH